MFDEPRLCRKCQQPISPERLEEVPVARFCESCLRPRPCERCGELIDVDRLEAIPETRQCMRCTRSIGEDTSLKVTTVNTRKERSMKGGSDSVSGSFGRKTRPG
jgi:RNA polymerase-binding transcription factor DksA